MSKIEKTKETIGVSKLDEVSRKRLFNKFIDAGGEVIREKDSDVSNNIQKTQKLQYKYKPIAQSTKNDIKKSTSKQKNVTRTRDPINEKRVLVIKKKAGPIRLFFERLHIRLRLYFMNVSDFYGYYFNARFIEKFDKEYNKALIEMQLVHIDLFKQDYKTSKKIISYLDNITPFYYELIEMIADVFDRTVINQIIEHYLNFPDIPQRTQDIKEPLLTLFKKLYPLYQYRSHIYDAFGRSIDFQAKIERGKSSLYSFKKKKTKNNIYIIFNKLFQRLYWLFCFFEGRIIPLNYSVEIESILNISKKEKPGRRKIIAPNDEIILPLVEKKTEHEQEENKIEIPNDVKKGLQIMYKLDLNRLREKYDRRGIFTNVSETDKILITYLLFREFDEEYSFILTTNKIKYNIISTSDGKIDCKTKFSDLYNEIRKCNEFLNDYASIIASYEKARKEKPINSAKYIEYSNRLNSLEEKKKQSSKKAKMTVKSFLEKFCNELQLLVDDMKSNPRIVVNSQDILSFESDIEGEKELDGKKVYEAISISYYYALALIYRLSPEGDLYSGLEYGEGENYIFHPGNNNKDADRSRKNKKGGDSSKRSVFDELEDFI